MTANELVTLCRKYLEAMRRSDGSVYGRLYLKDKTSDLRALLHKLDVRNLAKVSDGNFYAICDKGICKFSDR